MVDLQPLALVDCWRLEAAYNKRLNNQSSTLAVDVRSFSNSDYSNSMADKEENRFSLNLSRLSSGSQISGSTRETTTEKSKVLSQMVEDDLTFPLLALSDVAKARRRYMKVYPNKVYTPWYRRYVNCLPDGQRIDFQPGVEIRKVDEDIALQYFYGEDTPYIDEPTTKESNERRAQTLRRYTKLMEMRERTQSAKSETKQLDFNVSLQSIIAANKSKQPDLQEDFGPTVTQRAKIVPIINFMDKLKTLKMRQIRTVPKLQPNSKWKLFQLPLMRLKLRQYIKSTKQAAIRFRFRRFIQLVRCVYRFIHIISVISGDTKLIIKNVANFVEEQHKNTTLKVGVAQGKTKQIFDASKYKLSKRLQFSMAVKLILTKPWFERSEDEINEVIRTLQVLRSFVEYPSSSQRRLARVAWLIEVPSDKVIIRECHMAQDFYILLRGKAKMTKLSGSAVIGEPGAQKVIKWLKKDMVFGQESMFEPRSERKYTVISTDHCDMLAINIYDYLAMLMTTKDDEEAPEHIAFICTLDLLKDFPKTKLLEEGGENITLYFF
ncbi:cyclic nucleotide-binding domain-containing protein 2, partial [Biomphalaria glabrata]